MNKSLCYASLLLGLLPSTMNAADQIGYRSISVTEESGKVSYFRLAERPRMTFTSNEVAISCEDGTSVTFPNDSRLTFAFTEDIPTSAIGTEITEMPIFSLASGTTLEVSGLSTGAMVTIHCASGICVCSGIADGNGNISLPLPGETGIFIVTTSDNNSFKFIKK